MSQFLNYYKLLVRVVFKTSLNFFFLKYSSSSVIDNYQPTMEFSLEREIGTILDVAQEISRIEVWWRGALHCVLCIAGVWPRYLHADYFQLCIHIIRIPPSTPDQTEKLCKVLGSYKLKTLPSLQTLEDVKILVCQQTSAALSGSVILPLLTMCHCNIILI